MMKRMFLIFWLTTIVSFVLISCSPTTTSQDAATSQNVATELAATTEVEGLPTAVPPTETAPAQETTSPSAAAQTAAETETKDRGAALIGDAVIIYEKSGGFAGVMEKWTIYADGRVVDHNDNEWQIAPAEVTQFLMTSQAAGFFEMAENYVPVDSCCDFFTHVLTIRDGDTVHQVTTIDEAPNEPPGLQNLLRQVNDLLLNEQ